MNSTLAASQRQVAPSLATCQCLAPNRHVVRSHKSLQRLQTAAVAQTVSDVLELEPAVAQKVEQTCAGNSADLLQANIQELRKDYFLKVGTLA